MASVRVARLIEDQALGAGLGVAAGLTIGNSLIDAINDFFGLEGLVRQVPRVLVAGGALAYVFMQDATSRGLPQRSVRLPTFLMYWFAITLILGQIVEFRIAGLGQPLASGCQNCGGSVDRSRTTRILT